jgi:RNA polymerase sigma-70 factor (ECF subfamily)
MPTQCDRVAFDAAVLTHLDELYGTAVRLTRAPSDAEDLVQEAVMRAWAAWDRFEPGTNSRAWMHRILMNTFINGYRRKKREREVLARAERDAHARPQRIHEETTRRHEGVGDEVDAALADLPEEFRAVVLLVDLADQSYKEAARTLDCPIGTVMSRLHRARRLLQERLRGYASEHGYVRAA